jgi:hypothetical protein
MRNSDGRSTRCSARNVCSPFLLIVSPLSSKRIKHNKNWTRKRQILERFDEEIFEKRTIVSGTTKRRFIFDDLPETAPCAKKPRHVSSKRHATSCTIEDFPGQGERAHDWIFGFSTHLTMWSKKSSRVPGRPYCITSHHRNANLPCKAFL